MFVFCYRKRLKGKFSGDSKSQKEFRQFELENIPPSSNLIPSEPETPNQTDGNNGTFTFPVTRGRLSSSGSTNSTTPLLRYGTGSYRSRFSSGVSSRIDSNIAEGIRFCTSLLVRQVSLVYRTAGRVTHVTSNQTVLKVQSVLQAWGLWQNKP